MFDEARYNDSVSRNNEVRRHKAKQARIRRNRIRGLEFDERMYYYRSRHLLLFNTFNYKPERREDIGLTTIQNHRDTFFDYMESDSHPLLGDVCGAIWKLEEGERSGLHMHCLIYYSAKHRADISFNQRLGEYWVNVITKGWGAYWNSNARKADFEKKWGIGIGQVNRHGDPRRASLRLFIANYMAKASQVPRDRDADDKLFGVRVFDRKRKTSR